MAHSNISIMSIAPTRQLQMALRWAGWALLVAHLLWLTGTQPSTLGIFFDGFFEGVAVLPWASIALYSTVFILLVDFKGLNYKRIATLSILLGLSAYFFYARYLNGVTLPVLTCMAAIGVALLTELLLNRSLQKNSADQAKQHFLIVLLLWSGTFSITGFAGFNMVYVLQPWLWDYVTLAFDQTLGITIAPLIAGWTFHSSALEFFLSLVYGILPFGFAVILALTVRRGDAGRINFFAIWFSTAFAAWIAYHLVPVSGPIYIYGKDSLVQKMLEPVVTLTPGVSGGIFLRNGVPSMHFGWALMLVWLAYVEHYRKTMLFFVAFAVATVLATFGLGEHYFVDLVVSIPFMLWLFAANATQLDWRHPVRYWAFWSGVGLYVLWVLALRWGAPVWQDKPVVAWFLVLLTVGIAVPLHIRLAHLLRECAPRAHEPVVRLVPASNADDLLSAAQQDKRHLRMVTTMFVLSGMAGLMYEVLFSKILGSIFGSTALAAYTVLGTYMGGMALGAWLGGRWSERVKNPLLAYSICEGLVAVFFVLTPLLKTPIMDLYVMLAQGLSPDDPSLIPLRLTLGSLLLLLPTVAMGATLPLLVKDMHVRKQGVGVSVGRLYAANTLGAAMGAVIAGYVLIPSFGLVRGTLIAALVNLVVAVIALELSKKTNPQERESIQSDRRDTSSTAIELASHESSHIQTKTTFKQVLPFPWLPWILLAVGGVVTLALEVVYFHMLATVAGNSTYAFALMLAAFLLGLGAGGESARVWMQHGKNVLTGVLLAEWTLAMLIMVGTAIWSGLPEYFAAFAYHQLPEGFGPREVVRAAVCLLAMLPPAACIGFIYPLAMEWVTRSRTKDAVIAMGTASALNTVGNIGGVFIAAFVLLPVLGSLWSIKVLSIVAFAMAALVAWAYMRSTVNTWLTTGMLFAGSTLFVISTVSTPMQWDYTALSTGSNVYFRAQAWGTAIDHLESVDGGLTTVTENRDSTGEISTRTLLTNGKFQGNDAWSGEMVAQIGFALTPLLHTSKRDDALVIGYGSGVTARTLLDVGFQRVDIAELSRDIVQMANKHFSKVNAQASQNPKAHLYVTDGRNLMLLNSQRYDVVSIEISSIWFAGAAALYNVEFYDLVRQRLKPGGVLQQWIQLHHISELDLLTVIGSVRAKFPYVWFYMVGGQGIIIASENLQPPLKEHALLIDRTPTMQTLLNVYGGSATGIGKDLLLSPKEVDALLTSVQGVPASYWVSTDANARLEYSTPRGNVLDGADVVPNNIRFLTSLGQAKNLDW